MKHSIPREVMYHAKDTDKTAMYVCPDCTKKTWPKYRDTNIFCQEGNPVTTPYVCLECGKERRCLRFTPVVEFISRSKSATKKRGK